MRGGDAGCCERRGMEEILAGKSCGFARAQIVLHSSSTRRERFLWIRMCPKVIREIFSAFLLNNAKLSFGFIVVCERDKKLLLRHPFLYIYYNI